MQVDLIYDVPYSDEKAIEIAERVIAAGYETTTALEIPLRSSPHFVEEEWEVFVGGQGGIRIRLTIVEPDRDAAATLAPLADALGMVP